jgi:hypothetical protein
VGDLVVADARIVAEVDTGIQQEGQSPIITPGAAIMVASPLELTQFTSELAERLSLAANSITLTTNGDPLIASEESPVALWTDTVGVSADALLASALLHTPDPTWHPDSPAGGMSSAQLREKTAGGGALSGEEVQLALRYLLVEIFPA